MTRKRVQLKDLQVNSTYAVQIRAVNAERETGPWSTQLQFLTENDEVAPGPVTGLSGSTSGPAFLISFTAPVVDENGDPLEDLRDYLITVYPVGSPGSSVTFQTEDENLVLPLETNRSVFGTQQDNLVFEVQARDWTGNLSTVESVTINHGPPATPANLSASGGIRAITVTWDVVAESDLKKYNLHASQTSGFTPGAGNKIYEGNGTGFAHAVGNGETWYYKISAEDEFENESAFSTQVSATSLNNSADETAPSTVTGVVLNSTTYYHGAAELAYIDVSWSPSTDSESGIGGYIIRYKEGAGGAWKEEVAGPTDTSFRITGLVLGSTYYVQMKAVDKAGNPSGAWSTEVQSTPTTNGGDIAQNVTIVSGGAFETDNFVAGTSGTRLDHNSLEIYGSSGGAGDVSIILGGSGLNLNTVTDQMWFGNALFSDAPWRVDGSGDMRAGGADKFYIDGATGDIWSGNAIKASAPWEITGAGAARFDNVQITGASAADGQQVVNVGGDFIITKTLAGADVDLAGTMDVTGSITVSTGNISLVGGNLITNGGDVESASGYVFGGGVGFRLDGGTGVLSADSAQLDSLSVQGTSSFGGTMTVTGTMESDTVDPVNDGWQILSTGAATFASIDIRGGNVDIGASSAFHVDAAGNMWLGSSLFSSAPFKVSSAGEVTATSGTFSGTVSAATITGSTVNGGDINGADIEAGTGSRKVRIWENSGVGYVDFMDGTSVRTRMSLDATGDFEINGIVGLATNMTIAADNVFIESGLGSLHITSAFDILMDGDVFLEHNELWFGTGTTNDRIAFSTDTFQFYANATLTARIQYSSVGSGARFQLYGTDPQIFLTDTGNILWHDTGTDEMRLTNNGNLVARWGNTGVIMPNVYSSTTGSSANVHVDSAGRLYRSTSSARYKRNIVGMVEEDGRVINLTPVLFDGMTGNPAAGEDLQLSGTRHLGITAEDVAQNFPLAAVYDENGQPDAYEPNALVAGLIFEVRLIRDAISGLKSDMDTAKTRMQNLESRVLALETV